jgi:ketosteroid isomerase-like protein
MTTESNKKIVLAMLEDGSYLNPAVLTEDFTYTGVGNPDTLRGAGVPQTADRVIQGWQKSRELFRHPDGDPPADGSRLTVKSVVAEGDRVVCEIENAGVLKSDPSRELRKQFVNVYEFRGDRISAVRSYDDTAYIKSWADQRAQIVDAAHG